jgi:hypothetical protein
MRAKDSLPGHRAAVIPCEQMDVQSGPVELTIKRRSKTDLVFTTRKPLVDGDSLRGVESNIMASRPLKRARLAAANAQREKGPDPHDTPGAIPMSEASQELKDARAALSVLQNPLDPNAALIDLYPEAANMGREGRRRLRARTTQSDRVQRILRDDLSDLARQRKALITHQVEIALNREDPDNAIRAFAGLAKIAGWAAPIKVDVQSKSLTIHSLMSNPKAIQEALALMTHEPGAAVAIQSDARDDYERRHGLKPVDIVVDDE